MERSELGTTGDDFRRDAIELLIEALAWYEAYEEVPAPRSQTRKVLERMGYTFPTTPEGWKRYWNRVEKKRDMLIAAGHVEPEGDRQ